MPHASLGTLPSWLTGPPALAHPGQTHLLAVAEGHHPPPSAEPQPTFFLNITSSHQASTGPGPFVLQLLRPGTSSLPVGLGVRRRGRQRQEQCVLTQSLNKHLLNTQLVLSSWGGGGGEGGINSKEEVRDLALQELRASRPDKPHTIAAARGNQPEMDGRYVGSGGARRMLPLLGKRAGP